MSKDSDVESDSPVSKHDLNDVEDEYNIIVPNEHVVSFRSKKGEGGVEIHTTLHETFPPPVHSDVLSYDPPVYETSSLSTSKTVDLVCQPSRWGAELPTAIGLSTGVCKASLVTPQPSKLKPPVLSSCPEGNGMTLLSEACAAVSTPKYFSNIFDERPIQPAIRYDICKKTSSPSRQGFLPTHRKEVSNKDQRVMR